MRPAGSRLHALTAPLAVAPWAGSLLRAHVDLIGAAPRGLVECAAGLALGLALGPQLWRGAPGRGARVGGALLGLAAGALALRALPFPPSLPAAALAMGGLAAARPASGAGALGLALAGPLLLLGFTAPLPALALALLALAVGGAEPARPALPRGSEAASLALAAGAAALLSGAWVAGRARLDPSPGAFALGAAAALPLAALGRVAGPRRSGGAAALLAAAALATWLALGALPHRTTVWILPMAGTSDPRWALWAMGIALIAPGAFALGAARGGGVLTLAAVALGLWAGADTGPGLAVALLGGAGLAGLAGMALPGHWARRAAALALAGAALGAHQAGPAWDEPRLLRGVAGMLRTPEAPDELRAALDALEPAAGGWGPDGAALVLTRGGALAGALLDGAFVDPEGRAADSERAAGHLGAALAGRPRDAMVLGEARGLATRALLTQGFDHVAVHVPDPSALRAMAERSPALRATMLHPAVRLQHGPGEATLRASPPRDLLLELARTPWLDGHQGLPSATRLRLRRDRLREGGAYLLVVPLTRMNEAGLRALLADFVAVFPQSWALLPPAGADQLLLAGFEGEARVSWDRLVQVSALGFDELAPLGIRSPMDLADRALVGPEGLAALASGGGARPAWIWPGPTLHRRPAMLLPLLLPEVDNPAELLLAPVDPERALALGARADVNRGLLELLDQAARGDFKQVVSRSRALLEDPAGVRALDPVTRPFLDRAREQVALGLQEGPGSEAWLRCLRETEAARLLNPASAEVAATSARCRLARGDVRGAEADLATALEIDRGHLDALMGLAQLHHGRGELSRAEQRLREAARYNPRSWRPLYHLGSLLMELGRLDEADRVLLQAKGLAGAESPLPLGALAHVQLLKGDPNAALAYAELAVDRDPDAKHLHLRGWAFLDLGQLEQAERDLKAAVHADPDNFLARGDLGRVLALRGELTAAIDSFKAVLAADPGNLAAQENLRRALDAQARAEGRGP